MFAPDGLSMTCVLSVTVGELVSVNKEKAKIIVTADMAFSKRYLKYLAKKYLKKHSVRISSSMSWLSFYVFSVSQTVSQTGCELISCPELSLDVGRCLKLVLHVAAARM